MLQNERGKGEDSGHVALKQRKDYERAPRSIKSFYRDNLQTIENRKKSIFATEKQMPSRESSTSMGLILFKKNDNRFSGADTTEEYNFNSLIFSISPKEKKAKKLIFLCQITAIF